MNPWLRRASEVCLRILLVTSIVWGAIPLTPAVASPLPATLTAAAPQPTLPEAAAPAQLHSSYPVVGAFTQGGQRCNVLRIPAQPGVLSSIGPADNLANLNYNTIWSSYMWMSGDGAQNKIFRVQGTNLYLMSIAGSTPTLFSNDVEDLSENLFSEGGRGNPLAALVGTDPLGYIRGADRDNRFGSDYMQMTSVALQAAAGTDIPPGAQLVLAGHSQGGNVAQMMYLAAQSAQPTGVGLGVPRNAVGDALGVQGITVVGGLSAGSRPHQTVDQINRNQQTTTGKTPWVSQNERHDPVPRMYSVATAGSGDPLMVGLGTLYELANVVFKLPASLNMIPTAQRTTVLFDDPHRYGGIGENSAHGESYIDPNLQGRPGNYNINLPGEAHDVDRPYDNSPANSMGGPTAPDWLTLALNNGIEYVGGFAYDCYSAVTITKEDYQKLQQECRNPGDPYGVGPTPILQLIQERRNRPDGVPDQMWAQVTQDGAGQGRQLPPESFLQQVRQEIGAWRQAGQVGDNPISRYQNNNSLTINRDYLFVEDQGTLNPSDPCQHPPKPPGPGGPDDPGRPRRPPNGSPDDYEAPWRYQEPTQVSAAWLNDLVGDSSLEPWTPAWNTRLQMALQDRLARARNLGLPEAARFYRNLAAASNLVTRQTSYATDPEYGYLLAAQASLSNINEGLGLALAVGIHNGEPITDTQRVYDDWLAQLDTNSDWQTFAATALGQRVAADGLEWTTLLSQTTALVETYGAEGYATLVQREVNAVERAVKTSGVGVLKGGLDNWTQGALGYAGVPAHAIDPLTTAPADAPPVLLVPSGTLEQYEAWPYLRLWLEEYVGSGGKLLVLAQAYGRHWELLPGGQVQGLGFEEDIMCREESVQVMGLSLYLGGLDKEIADVQVDGSFTGYPANARMLLQRRTGNLAPAMIEYPYGAGWVLATSLYPDFAAVNGLQARDDLALMRTFFLQAWVEATGEPPEAVVAAATTYTFTVEVKNHQATPWEHIEVYSEYSRDAVDVWRYRAHYDSLWGEYGYGLSSVEIPLTPPLAPGETRQVTATLRTPRSAGLHRLALVGNSSSRHYYNTNALPGPLYLVESPFYMVSSTNMRAQLDRARYWADEVFTATVVLSPTANLVAPQVVTLMARPAVFPSQPVTLTPGTLTTVTVSGPVGAVWPSRFALLYAIAPDGRVAASTSLPLVIDPVRPARLELSGPATAASGTTLPFTLTNTGTDGTAYTGTVALYDARGRWLAEGALAGQVAQRRVGAALPAAQLHTLPLPELLAAGWYELRAEWVEAATGLTRQGKVFFWVPGTADLVGLQPARYAYAVGETLAATATLQAVSPLNGWLHLAVLGGLENLTVEPLAGQGWGTDAVGAQAAFDLSTSWVAASGERGRAWMLTDGGYDDNPTMLLELDLATGAVRPLAGRPDAFGQADGLPAQSVLQFPGSLAVSGDGRTGLMFETTRCWLRQVNLLSGQVTRLSGGTCGYADGVGAAVQFSASSQLALSPDGSYALVADKTYHVIRYVDLTTGQVVGLVGKKGSAGSANGVGGLARLNAPRLISLDHHDHALIVDANGLRYLTIERAGGLVTGTLTTAAGGISTSGIQGLALTPGGTGVAFFRSTKALSWLQLVNNLGVITATEKALYTPALALMPRAVTLVENSSGPQYTAVVNYDADYYDADDHVARVDFNVDGTGAPTEVSYQFVAGTPGAQAGQRTGGAGLGAQFEPGPLAVAPGGQYAFLAGQNYLYHLDLQTGEVVVVDTLDNGATDLAVSPTDDYALIVDGESIYQLTYTRDHTGLPTDASIGSIFTNWGWGCDENDLDTMLPSKVAISVDASYALIGDSDNNLIWALNPATLEGRAIAGSCSSYDDSDGPALDVGLWSLSDVDVKPDNTGALVVQDYYLRTLAFTIAADGLPDNATIRRVPIDDAAFDRLEFRGGVLAPTSDYAWVYRKIEQLNPEGTGYYDYTEVWGVDLATGAWTPLITPHPATRLGGPAGEFGLRAALSGLAIAPDGTALYISDAAWGLVRRMTLGAPGYQTVVPVSGSGTWDVAQLFTDLDLAAAPALRGRVWLQGTLYGPHPAASAVVTEHQVLAERVTPLYISDGPPAPNLAAAANAVRPGTGVALAAVARNLTAQAGLVVTLTHNGGVWQVWDYPTLAPDESVEINTVVTPTTAGTHVYQLWAAETLAAEVTVEAIQPTLTVQWPTDTPLVSAEATWMVTVTNISRVAGQFHVQVGTQPTVSYTIAPNTTLPVPLTASLPPDAPAVWEVPVQITGDLAQAGLLQAYALWAGGAQAELGSGLFYEPTGETVQYTYQGAPVALPPAYGTRGVSVTFQVTQTGVVDDVDVLVDISHPDAQRLTLELISPRGIRVRLVTGSGGQGADFQQTWFDDAAPRAWGAPPNPGRVRPTEALNRLTGEPAAGTWVLHIVDHIYPDGASSRPFLAEGQLNQWGLRLRTVDTPWQSQAWGGGPAVIPDGGAVTTTLTVAAATFLRDLEVWLDALHPAANTLQVTLYPPTGEPIALIDLWSVGGSGSYPGYHATQFDVDANNGLGYGVPPLTGRYRPEDVTALQATRWTAVAGDWTLVVADTEADGVTGVLAGWRLEYVGWPQPPVAGANTTPVSLGAGVSSASSDIVLADPGVVQALALDIAYTSPSDCTSMYLTLKSPSGKSVSFYTGFSAGTHNQRHIYPNNNPGAYPSELAALLNTPVAGAWRLTLSKSSSRNCGAFTWNLSLMAATPQTYPAVGGPVALSGPGVITLPLTINDAGAVQSLQANLAFTQTGGAGLRFTLLAPNGTAVRLLESSPDYAASYAVTLDDSATLALTTGRTPFSGVFRPLENLHALAGGILTGDWQLRVESLGAGLAVVHSWGLRVTAVPATPAEYRWTGALPLTDGRRTTVSTLTLNDPRHIGTLRLKVDLAHPAVEDLFIMLVSPSGTRRIVWNESSGSGEALSGTIFDQWGTSLAPPYTGYLHSYGLEDFKGEPIAGEWQLVIEDWDYTYWGRDEWERRAGQINSWGLIIVPLLSETLTSTATPIPLQGPVVATLPVTDTGAVEAVQVKLSVTHPNVRELELLLVAPNGETNRLFRTNNPGSGLSNTVFDDAGAAVCAWPPCNGRYRPDETFRRLTGAPAAGDWQLRAVDTTRVNSGTLTSWTLTLTQRLTATLFTTTDGPWLIPAGGSVTAPLPATGSGAVQDLNVLTAITHTTGGDLQVALLSPQGTQVRLATGQPGVANGSAGRWFDDEAYGLDGATYSAYMPTTPLRAVDGAPLAGVWTLVVTNTAATDGWLDHWTLNFGELVTTTYSLGSAAPVPDRQVARVPITVTAGDDIFSGWPAVTLNLAHPRLSDLNLRLLDPAGVQVTTFEESASLQGVDLRGTVFTGNWSVDNDIRDAVAPYTGRFRKNGLGYLEGAQLAGTWTLELEDAAWQGQAGVLHNWQFGFTPQPHTPYAGAGLPLPIRDGTAITSSLWVNQPGRYVDVDLTVALSHTYLTDLRLTLVAPDGTRRILFDRRGSGGRDMRVTFDDELLTGPNPSGSALLSGRYSPQEDFDFGERRGNPFMVAGEWQLVVEDLANADEGVLQSWTLAVASETEVLTYTAPGGPFPMTEALSQTLTLPLADVGLIQDVNVVFTATHINSAGFLLDLQAPARPPLMLWNNDATQLHDPDFSPAGQWLDDAADCTLYWNTYPYPVCQPYEALAALNGVAVNGDWQLRAVNWSAYAPYASLEGWGVAITRQRPLSPVFQPGQAFALTVPLTPTRVGLQVLRVEGLETAAQLPFDFTNLNPVQATVVITVPTTLPGGIYTLTASFGETTRLVPVTVENWNATLALTAPAESVPAGTPFTVMITITETRGVNGAALLIARYGNDQEFTQELDLLAGQSLQVPVVFTATMGAGRVTGFVTTRPVAPVNGEAPPSITPAIDSVPVLVHDAPAYVNLFGVTAEPSGPGLLGRGVGLHDAPATVPVLRGELVIASPISSTYLALPTALGGTLLFQAQTNPAVQISSTTSSTGWPQIIDLTTTPTGTWPFSVTLPANLQRARYALDFAVNEVRLPVQADLDGVEITTRLLAVDTSNFPTVRATVRVESNTALAVTPLAEWRGGQVTLAPTHTVTLQPGAQTFTFDVGLPESTGGSGEVFVGFMDSTGEVVAGVGTALAFGQAELLDLALTSAERGQPTSAVVDLVTLSTAELRLLVDGTVVETLPVLRPGYQTITVSLTVPAHARAVQAVLLDSQGRESWLAVDVATYLTDSVSPTVLLDALADTYSTPTWMEVAATGQASDGGGGICQVRVNGVDADFSPQGAYTATLRLPPNGAQNVQATAWDCDGNRAESTVRTVTVTRALAATQWATAAYTITEASGVAQLTVQLSEVTNITTTVDYELGGGTATPGVDYTAVSGTLVFPPWWRTRVVTFTLAQDGVPEPTETLLVTLTRPVQLNLGTTQVASVLLQNSACATLPESYGVACHHSWPVPGSYLHLEPPVTFGNFRAGMAATVTITVTGVPQRGTRYLHGWFDWGRDGVFDASDQVYAGVVPAGVSELTFTVPATLTAAVNYRFRLYDGVPVGLMSQDAASYGDAQGGDLRDGTSPPPTPTAVTLAAFDAVRQDTAILVTWETAAELNNLGFNLYRSTVISGPWTLLNSTGLIPPQFPGAVQGGAYAWLDPDVALDTVYYYRLEDVDTQGVRTFHGPVWAVLTDPRRWVYLPLVLRLAP